MIPARKLSESARKNGLLHFVVVVLATCFLMAQSACGQPLLDTLDDSLFLESPKGTYRVDLSGLFDLEGYYIDQRPPGLIFGGRDSFITPRLSLFLDAHAG